MRPQHAGCNEITAQDLLASVRPFIAPIRIFFLVFLSFSKDILLCVSEFLLDGL